jgi:HEAT repeat protein
VDADDFTQQSTESLIALTLSKNEDDHDRWKPVYVLQDRGTPEVFEAARRLCGSGDPREDDLAIRALIELSTDEDSDVRDWSTFGLGSQVDVDTPALREALANRLDDPDEDTSAESVEGLARRQDERAVPAIVAWIEAGYDGMYVRNAVEAFRHPAVLAALARSRALLDEEGQAWAVSVLAEPRASARRTPGHRGPAR